MTKHLSRYLGFDQIMGFETLRHFFCSPVNSTALAYLLQYDSVDIGDGLIKYNFNGSVLDAKLELEVKSQKYGHEGIITSFIKHFLLSNKIDLDYEVVTRQSILNQLKANASPEAIEILSKYGNDIFNFVDQAEVNKPPYMKFVYDKDFHDFILTMRFILCMNELFFTEQKDLPNGAKIKGCICDFPHEECFDNAKGFLEKMDIKVDMKLKGQGNEVACIVTPETQEDLSKLMEVIRICKNGIVAVNELKPLANYPGPR